MEIVENFNFGWPTLLMLLSKLKVMWPVKVFPPKDECTTKTADKHTERLDGGQSRAFSSLRDRYIKAELVEAKYS